MMPSEQQLEKRENIIKQVASDNLLRGKSPDGIKQRCVELCRQYLATDTLWSQVTEKDIEIRRLTGGLTNQLYFVGFKNGKNVKTLAIKFYQSKFFKKEDFAGDERLSDTIISIIISERKIGPKIYGVFPGGIIQSYHEHEQFRRKQQQNPKLLRKVAHRLAEVNNLDVPIEKDRFVLLKILHRYIHEGYKRMDLKSLTRELELSHLMENDFMKEMDLALEFFKRCDQCPTVFCHNDFRGNNIMVEKGTDEILLCDFEYSSYGYRGYDMASFLLEWDREFLDFRTLNLPSREILEKFVGYYLEGCDLVKPSYSSAPENAANKIMADIYIGFWLVLTWYLGFILNQREAVIEGLPYDVKHQAQYINLLFKYFLMVKEKLIDEKIASFN